MSTLKDLCTDECRSMLSVESINNVFSRNLKNDQEKAVGCFYSCWYDSFLQSARIIYSSYSAGYVNEMADLSFTDAMLAFMEKAAGAGLYQANAKIRSIAFIFFRNKLHERIRNDKFKSAEGDAAVNGMIEYKEENKGPAMYLCLEKIKKSLSEEDSSICEWKFTRGESNSEIAERLKITTNSFTNRLYRLTTRMGKLMNDCIQSQPE